MFLYHDFRVFVPYVHKMSLIIGNYEKILVFPVNEHIDFQQIFMVVYTKGSLCRSQE